ncbi:MFS transporter [Actinocorallia sp. A-T 12471]|uniref:MFS transporter n=1 Tax=Actinocorallia sp. A-T 12471 TaxID=3089813 RepID=UPI0029CE8678|nr:MFS transporter [Actinocorallia sp. A-T 12471]MDX6739638.1 MFS transporter [Actinocorallia sp. A-T 12471]
MGLRGGPVLLGHAVLIQLVTFVLRPTMSYRALELDVPAAALGVLAASFAFAPLVLALPVGQLTDRIGERRIVLAGAACVAAAALVFTFLGDGLAGLLCGSVLLGVGHLGCVVGQQALVANTSARGGYDTAFGHYTFAASLGQSLGPTLILLFGGDQQIPHTDRIFTACVGAAALLVVLSFALPDTRRTASAAKTGDEGGFRELVRLPGLVRALTTSCIVIAAVDITLAYLPALGAERGLASGTVGLLLTVRGLASMGSRFFLGRMAARLGRRRLLTTSTAASGLAMAVLPFDLPLAALLAVMAVAGFGLGIGQPLTMSWLAEASPPGLRGRAMALRLLGNRTGQIIIPSAAGALAAGLGVAGVLYATALALGYASLSSRTLPVDASAPADN